MRWQRNNNLNNNNNKKKEPELQKNGKTIDPEALSGDLLKGFR
jgi:hypothetical protein